MLAEAGIGLACVPDFSIRRQLADGSLVTVLDEYIDHKGVFRAVWPSSRYVPAQAARVHRLPGRQPVFAACGRKPNAFVTPISDISVQCVSSRAPVFLISGAAHLFGWPPHRGDAQPAGEHRA
ncbi:MAG: hypothetical protein WDN69_11770 [Aliidongia sp.]